MVEQKFAPREVAKRVFAAEIRAIDQELARDTANDKTPRQFLLPTGGAAKRIFLVGSLTERDDIGGDTEYWRGRVVDPTGNILIYAGQYQPEAAQVLAELELPCYVAVMGKISLYETEEGKVISSIRAESVAKVDENARKRWILETAHLTAERLKTPDPVSREHYGESIKDYEEMVRTAMLEFSLVPKKELADDEPEQREFSDDDSEEIDCTRSEE